MEAEIRKIIYPSIVVVDPNLQLPVDMITEEMQLRCGDCGLFRECRPSVVDKEDSLGPGTEGECVGLQACRIANRGQIVV